MDDLPMQVLHELMTFKVHEPMTPAEANELATSWRTTAADNGVSAGELDEVAGMRLQDYILRTYGESGEELKI